ncbi:hypothetical protein HDU97_005154 [Phlyctochytrium planicorne]|nr:hypothetical protein HDU97_005154 [Phlyctochytrium planicorne]
MLAHIQDGKASAAYTEYLVALRLGWSIKDQTQLKLVGALVESGKLKMAKNVAEHVLHRHPRRMGPLKQCMSRLAEACIQSGKMDMAWDVLEMMKGKDMLPSPVVYTRLLEQQLETGKLGGATETLKQIKEMRGSFDEQIYGILIARFLEPPISNRGIAETIYNEMVQKLWPSRPTDAPETPLDKLKEKQFLHLGTLILTAHAEAGDYVGAMRLFRFMMDNSIHMDVAAYTTVMAAGAKANCLQFSEAWFRNMVQQDIPLDEFAFHAMLNAYVRANKIEEAFNLFEKLSQKFFRDDAPDASGAKLRSFNALLKLTPAKKHDRIGFLSKILQMMKDQNLLHDAFTYTALVSQLTSTDLVMRVFQAAIAQARREVREHFRSGTDDDRNIQLAVSNALYTQVLQRLKRNESTVLQVLHVRKTVKEFGEFLPPDDATLYFILDGLRAYNAHDKVVETFMWMSNCFKGSLFLCQSTRERDRSFNVCFHLFLQSCLFNIRRQIRCSKFGMLACKAMERCIVEGNPVNATNWFIFVRLLIRLRQDPLVPVQFLTRTATTLAQRQSLSRDGRSILAALKITKAMVSALDKACDLWPYQVGSLDKDVANAKGDARWDLKSEKKLKAFSDLEAALRQLAALDPEFVDPKCFNLFKKIKKAELKRPLLLRYRQLSLMQTSARGEKIMEEEEKEEEEFDVGTGSEVCGLDESIESFDEGLVTENTTDKRENDVFKAEERRRGEEVLTERESLPKSPLFVRWNAERDVKGGIPDLPVSGSDWKSAVVSKKANVNV